MIYNVHARVFFAERALSTRSSFGQRALRAFNETWSYDIRKRGRSRGGGT